MRWIPVATAAVLMFAVAPAARADALADARKAVDGSDYPTARTLLVSALEAGTAGPDALAEIYKLTGIVEGALGNATAATDAFSKWLSLDARGALPLGTSPKIMRPFTAAQDKAKKRGLVEAKAKTEDNPPAVTLVVVNDPHKLIASAKVYFRVDNKAEQSLEAAGTEQIKLELETGKRIDLRLHAVDKYGNHVVELGSKDVPIVITSSGTTKQIIDPEDRKLFVKKRTEPAPPPSPRALYAQWWVWGIGTIVATGTGGFFAWRTRQDINELDALNANSLSHRFSDAQTVESRAHRDLLITNISAGVAGAFAIGTAILYFTRPDTSETRVAVTPTAGGGAIVLGGQF